MLALQSLPSTLGFRQFQPSAIAQMSFERAVRAEENAHAPSAQLGES